MIWPTRLHAVWKIFHRCEVVSRWRLWRRWRLTCLQLRKLSINLRLFLNEFRMRRVESKMIAFQRLGLVAEKCKDRFDLVKGAFIRYEIFQIVEKFGKTHIQSDLADSAPEQTNRTQHQ